MTTPRYELENVANNARNIVDMIGYSIVTSASEALIVCLV